MIIEEILQSYLRPEEQYIYGFAELTGLLPPKFEGFNFGISIGRRLNDHIVDSILHGPTQEYYSHYRQINTDLEQLTAVISKDLINNGINSIRIEPTVNTSELDSTYSKTLRTDLSHKLVATRSGLGWIGKTDLFVSNKFGPRLRLVSILINSPVKPQSKPVERSRCGKCNLCADVCPAQAANGKLWDISVEREEFFDPFKCRKQCAEFGRSRLGLDVRICGMCIAVCPVGKKKD